MLAIIGWIVFGLIAGLIAKAIMPGKDPGGFIITTLLGIVGAVIGGWIGHALFGTGSLTGNDVNSPGLIVSLVLSVVGAIVVLAVYRLIVGRSLRA
ncbi:MAG: GlsB/YeaQ/YmgE family stress response membrane protein [Pyrinomonadaceae bacterium]|nr:GlsB/YeaQ/YmgE family stress response membrane protein [Pyrinomonadaceae bacterium]